MKSGSLTSLLLLARVILSRLFNPLLSLIRSTQHPFHLSLLWKLFQPPLLSHRSNQPLCLHSSPSPQPLLPAPINSSSFLTFQLALLDLIDTSFAWTLCSQLLPALIASTLLPLASTMYNSCCSILPIKQRVIDAATGRHNGIDFLQAPSMASWIMVTFSSSPPLIFLILRSPLLGLSLSPFLTLPAISLAPLTSNLAF